MSVITAGQRGLNAVDVVRQQRSCWKKHFYKRGLVCVVFSLLTTLCSNYEGFSLSCCVDGDLSWKVNSGNRILFFRRANERNTE